MPLLSLLSLLAAVAQIMADAAGAGAAAEVDAAAAADTTDILFTVTQPARPVTTGGSCAPSFCLLWTVTPAGPMAGPGDRHVECPVVNGV